MRLPCLFSLASLAVTTFSIASCTHSTSTQLNGNDSTKTLDTAIAWTNEAGTILSDKSADWQPRDAGSFQLGFRPFFPNPAHGTGTVSFSLPSTHEVKVIMDTSEIYFGMFNAGTYQVEVNLASWKPGNHKMTIFTDSGRTLVPSTSGIVRVE